MAWTRVGPLGYRQELQAADRVEQRFVAQESFENPQILRGRKTIVNSKRFVSSTKFVIYEAIKGLKVCSLIFSNVAVKLTLTLLMWRIG